MDRSNKKETILIFGGTGFIGSNIIQFFGEYYEIISLKIDAIDDVLEKCIKNSDIIIHAAGVSRSDCENDFFKVNIEFSSRLCWLLSKQHNKKILYFSSIHFNRNDIYGFSKRYNEFLFSNRILNENNSISCIRTPGVFGPGSKPNYVSVVSTFCYNFANNLPSIINDPEKNIELIFIGDMLKVIESILLNTKNLGFTLIETPAVGISVGELYSIIEKISLNRSIQLAENHDTDFINQIMLTYKYYQRNG